ncbi:MAG: hypothetical protein JWO95_580 [Verrucomicrobiales bacterium]|nr:hypothetical protein [Verrucomicrobiales bacterium]
MQLSGQHLETIFEKLQCCREGGARGAKVLSVTIGKQR